MKKIYILYKNLCKSSILDFFVLFAFSREIYRHEYINIYI